MHRDGWVREGQAQPPGDYNALERAGYRKGGGRPYYMCAVRHLLDKLDDTLSVAQLHHACRHVAGAQIGYKVRLRVEQGRAAAAGQ